LPALQTEKEMKTICIVGIIIIAVGMIEVIILIILTIGIKTK